MLYFVLYKFNRVVALRSCDSLKRRTAVSRRNRTRKVAPLLHCVTRLDRLASRCGEWGPVELTTEANNGGFISQVQGRLVCALHVHSPVYFACPMCQSSCLLPSHWLLLYWWWRPKKEAAKSTSWSSFRQISYLRKWLDRTRGPRSGIR